MTMKDGAKGMRMNGVKHFHPELQTATDSRERGPLTLSAAPVTNTPAATRPTARRIDERNEENRG